VPELDGIWACGDTDGMSDPRPGSRRIGRGTDFCQFLLSESSFRTGFKGNGNVEGAAFSACSLLPYDFEQIE
jgi:hypothetical protein